MAYPPIEAAKLSALSVSGVKIYAKRYAPFFSPSANPERNVPRSYTPEDVARLRLIGSLAKQGIPTAEIMARLESGETGDMPTDAPQNVIDGPQAPQQQNTALALAQQAVSALQECVQLDTNFPSHRLALAQQAVSALQDVLATERAERQDLARQLQDARERAARLEAELSAAKMPWWKKLFGG